MATKSSNLRDQIRSLLHESMTSVEEDLEALSHCEAQIRNRCIVEHLARECGLTLAGFLTNDVLELYYGIKQGRHDLGYISKGWEDPGFRIGDLVEVGWWDKDIVQANSHHIMRLCAINGITLTIQEAPIAITLQLDGVLYSEGFNRSTFQKTLDCLLPITATRRFLNTQPAQMGTGVPPPDAHFFPCRAFSAASASCWR